MEKTGTSSIKYCFVDFDETLRHATPEGYAVATPEEIEVFPWAIERLKEAKKQGYFIVGITNQNYYSRTRGAEYVQMMCDATLEKLGMKFPVFFSQTPAESKPNPWMLEQAEKKFGKANKVSSVMVGDRPDKDGAAAKNFGIPYVHVDQWKEKGLP
jgi:HAD superfamily hydrolase (TIGR01662 family)